MRDYGIVSPRFWTGETGRSLRGDPEAQVLALYLMTCPHSTMTGVFDCPILYMAHETGLGIEGAREGLQKLLARGFCEYDEGLEMVFVVRMAAYQIGESLKFNDKRIEGLKKMVRQMPDSPLKTRFLSVYGYVYHLQELMPKEAPSQAPSEPLRSQDQEQEQDQELLRGAKAPSEKPPELVLNGHGPPEPAPVVVLPCVGGREVAITPDEVAEWAQTFPGVEITANLLRMRAWLKARPRQRKTVGGVRKFVVAWLGKEQDAGHKGGKHSAQDDPPWAGAL